MNTTPRQAAPIATGIRPRVLVTVSIRPKADTGVQVHVDGFMRYARERGIATTLITPFDAPAAMVYPFFGIGRVAKPFHKGAWLAWHRYSHLVMLRWRLQQALVGSTERHIVYAQSPVAARAALEMRAAGHQLDVVLAAHFNGSEADEWAVRGCVSRGDRLYTAMRALERDIVSRVDRIVSPSRFFVEAWQQHTSAPETIDIVPNFAFAPARPAAGDVTGDLITIGTLEPRKNQEFLLQVLAAARARGRLYRLTIVGDGVLAGALRARASELGIADTVCFTGFVPRAAPLLWNHRVYVHSAQLENCPIVLIEALATGRPICAAPVGGIPEVFRDGVEGAYWRLDDPDDGATRLIALLEDPVRYTRTADAARARFESTFAPDVIGPRLLDTVLGAKTWRPR